MDSINADLGRRFEAGKLLGYLNFSDGRPDLRFRKLLADVFAYLIDADDPTPWKTTAAWLAAAGDELEASGAAAFRDLSQARFIRTVAFETVLTAYRRHHADLLAHQSDGMLFTAFFLARACEVTLRERGKKPNADAEALAQAVVRALDDYVGYRPIAVLETRPQTEFYPHEKVAAVPVYFAGVGVAPGPYAALVRPALELLGNTNAVLREEAGFELANLDELAVDPRAADHFHPVTKRPNVLFGEWDPHHIDNRGNYRRFILRQPTLDALYRWAKPNPNGPFDGERLFESAAVLAGTILMGAGVSGSGPAVYDSSVTLTTLVQRIARYRDEFYKRLLEQLPGAQGERLRAEAAKLKQPFAGVRQFLNQSIATERALHLQERRLAMLFAAMGYPATARRRAANIPAPSVRFSCEVRIRQTGAEFAAKAGRPKEAANLLAEAEDLIHRGIDCGAMIDPWNVLGFQGLFPIFPGREDTVRDPRAEELILTVGRQFDRYALTLTAAVAGEDNATVDRLIAQMQTLAEWWDRFATTTVSDMPRVLGSERADAAKHVANALALWRKAGTSANDIGFWRKHREGFRTPSAFAQVIDALLDTGDYKGALALLMTWLAEAPKPGADAEVAPGANLGVPLQDPSASFVRLAFRWLKGLCASDLPGGDKSGLIRRFFELLEANAEDRWRVPTITRGGAATVAAEPDEDEEKDDEDNDLFASAYEGMSFKDSAEDGTEGSLAEGGGNLPPTDFPLEADSDAHEDRLRFLAAVARWWRTVARPELWLPYDAAASHALGDWLQTARGNMATLTEFIDRLAEVELPAPSTGVDGVMEFDRRRSLKGHLLDLAVSTVVETATAIRALTAALTRAAELPSAEGGPRGSSDQPAWEEVAVRLERAIASNDPALARKFVAGFVPLFRHEPLLVHPPADGGPPGPAVRTQSALHLLESLLARLPRLGLLRETYQLTKLARAMERNSPPEGRRVSSFDQLFRTAVANVADAMLASIEAQPKDAADPNGLFPVVRQVADSFQKLWLEHSHSLRLSALESVLDDDEWNELATFVRTYGSELFTVRFLTLSNIRGILTQGTETWLNNLAEADAQGNLKAEDETPKILEAWTAADANRTQIARHLEVVLQSLVEHYDEYRDYNTTTTQSDYGENLYILLDFLRLKVSYERVAWRLKPFILVHEVLCRRGLDDLAGKWREYILGKTQSIADELMTKLEAREQEHSLRVRTVRNRLEERFVQPLQIDQAAARVARAAAVARDAAMTVHGGVLPETSPVFLGLLDVIRPLAESPSGVGLDVPVWLRRLEDELRKFRTGPRPADTDEADPPDDPLLPPITRIDFAELKRQLADWDKAIGE
ncbi:hypothetical protein [Limnoglobus roseus]|uniref:Uncharacterized protein n=1 Tax=Limnoglobus roseus TaxID=2598579 RepID=A0A5C1ASP6_9BACT|nr:hypothetical protein [Limnoglobus roseus]QEL20274.1 hypothetical protein PX52LOC_07366 [Limnoglobus roseus]